VRAIGLTFNNEGIARLPDGISVLVHNASFADDESFPLPQHPGWGEVVSTTDETYMKFLVQENGDVILVIASDNMAITDTGDDSGDICVYDDGGTLTLTNRTGGAEQISLIYYFQDETEFAAEV